MRQWSKVLLVAAVLVGLLTAVASWERTPQCRSIDITRRSIDVDSGVRYPELRADGWPPAAWLLRTHTSLAFGPARVEASRGDTCDDASVRPLLRVSSAGQPFPDTEAIVAVASEDVESFRATILNSAGSTRLSHTSRTMDGVSVYTLQASQDASDQDLVVSVTLSGGGSVRYTWRLLNPQS